MTHQHTPALPASKRLAWLLAFIAALVVLVGLRALGEPANALNPGDVHFDVAQSPAGGAGVFVQQVSNVSFHITSGTGAAINPRLLLDFDYPAGLAFVSSVSNPVGVTCTDNSPNSGILRCDYGPVSSTPALAPLDLTFSATGAFTTTAGQFVMRAGPSDAATQAPDSFTGAGDVAVFSSSNITFAESPAAVSPIFEGSYDTYTAVFTNTTAAGTGPFNVSVALPGTTVQPSVNCSASGAGASGTASGTGSSTALCTGSELPAGESLTLTVPVFVADASAGAQIVPTISAPALGISRTGSAITVQEVGLSKLAGTLNTGSPVDVCTASVASDAANLSAAGAAQPTDAALLRSPQTSLLPLATGDFVVTGPGVGAITASPACALNQSGVRFTPSAAGSYSVTARYNTGGTNVLSLDVGAATNPAPTLTSISPSTANAGSSGFTLTVTGTGFVSGSKVQWNGVDRTTTYVDLTHLTAAISAGDVATAASASVTVVNPLPGGGTSLPQTFTIANAPNPVPTLSTLPTSSTVALGPQFTLTVAGTNFIASSVIQWNGAPLVTTYTSPTSLSATVPATNIATPATVNISVFNPSPGGGTSASLPFTITSAATKLAFTSQPGNGVSNAPLSAQPVIAVQTSGGTTVTSDNATSVTLALVGAGSLTCTGGLSKTVTSGIATFAGCTVSGSATGLTLTATATSLTSATSASFNVTAAPAVSSTQLVVAAPAVGVNVPRSRLTFTATVGNISPVPTALTFVIKRKSDNKYWNNTAAAWQADPFENPAVESSTAGAWTFAVTGEARRQFVATTVIITAHASTDAALYESTTKPEIAIR